MPFQSPHDQRTHARIICAAARVISAACPHGRTQRKKQINNDLFSISLSCKSRFFILHHVAFLEATETSSWCTKEY
ncbi:hypothetical protein P4439_28960, partial [Bacillus thuringiensis]|nr:hypothetical protein [Bacillus thuringiensis]